MTESPKASNVRPAIRLVELAAFVAFFVMPMLGRRGGDTVGPPPVAAPAPEPKPKPRTILAIIGNVIARISRDNLTLVAAGVAFYAMLAVFPALAAMVSIYGLFADAGTIQAQVASLSGLVPASSLKLITDALHGFAGKSHAHLSLAVLFSLALALWSAKSGISSVMTGLNIANEQEEKRGYIRQQFVALALTLGGIAFAIVVLACVAVVPAVVALLGLEGRALTLFELSRWPALAVLSALAFAVFYRFGPYREQPRWRWITWGTATGTILWLAGSALFSFYIANFSSYDATYGSLAAVVILLLWLWVSALVLLVGAEIDAELQFADGRAARPLPPPT